MGPKAKPAAKKKEGNPQDGPEMSDAVKLSMFMLQANALHLQIGKLNS